MTEPTEPNPKSTSIEKQVRDWRREFERIYIVTKTGAIGLYRSQLPRMAAALAFRTIFSIIPVMAIGLLIFGAFVSEQQVESGVRRVLDFAGVSQIAITEEEVQRERTHTLGSEPDAEPDAEPDDGEGGGKDQAPGEGAVPGAGDAEAQALAWDQALEHSDNPFANADLEQVITDLITRVNSSIRNVPTGWIALTSGLVLLYAAMSLLVEIERSFNQLCGAPSGRPWRRRLMLYWTILTAGSLMLAATFLASDAFTRWVVSIAGQDSIVGAVMAGYGVSVLISIILLLGAYTTIPNTHIRLRSALAGAFIGAVLWELGKLGFTTYLRFTPSYSKFYGSIAILPLFLLWIYLTWLIVLFGVQATYALQNFQSLVSSKLNPGASSDDSTPALMDPLVALSVARAILEGFEEGHPLRADQIAERTGLAMSQAVPVIEALHKGGLVNRVEEGDREPSWTPSRPGEKTPLDELLGRVQSLDAFRGSAGARMLPDSVLGAAVASCKGKTLSDLGGSGEPESAPR